jgi:hypothetical protein
LSKRNCCILATALDKYGGSCIIDFVELIKKTKQV